MSKEIANSEIVSTEEFSEILNKEILSNSFRRLLAGKATKDGARGEVDRFEVNGIRFVARLYRRGGLVSKLSDSKFLHIFSSTTSTTRPFREHRVLEFLGDYFKGRYLVPKPAAAMICWGARKFYYRGLIVTVEIPGAESLLDLRDSIAKNEITDSISQAANISLEILEQGVFHTDLHLGNVLKTENSVFLIDFDKAKLFDASSELEVYKKKTCQRWSRSVARWVGQDADSREYFERPFLKVFESA